MTVLQLLLHHIAYTRLTVNRLLTLGIQGITNDIHKHKYKMF